MAISICPSSPIWAELPPSTLMIYQKLRVAERAAEARWPSFRHLDRQVFYCSADALSKDYCSASTAQRAIKALKATGLIQQVPNAIARKWLRQNDPVGLRGTPRKRRFWSLPEFDQAVTLWWEESLACAQKPAQEGGGD